MAWVAIDRAVLAVERFGLDGPVERWRMLRSQMHAEICQRAVDPGRGCFVRAYGSSELDASLLLLPLVDFLPPGDPRVIRTIAAVQHELCQDGFVAATAQTSRAPPTAWPAARVPSSRAVSGWSTISPWPGGATRQSCSSSSFSTCATM
jgi:hypothetical protein